jgi:hypothetical protein
MLNFKLREYQAAFDFYSPVLSNSVATLPLNSVLFFANNDMDSYSSKSNFSFIDMSDKTLDKAPTVIRGSALTDTTMQTYVPNPINSTETLSTSGSHTGTTIGSTANDFRRPSFSDNKTTLPNINVYNATAGEHSHSIQSVSLVNKYIYPKSLVVASYKLTSNNLEVPKNAIIFTTYSNEDYDLIESSKDGCCLISGNSVWVATNSIANNGIYGKNSYVSNELGSAITSNSGDHNHISGTTDRNFTNTTYSTKVYENGDSTISIVGRHNHQMTYTADITINRTTLKTYKANKNTGIFYGMIIGYHLTSGYASLPSGWYYCNGQTVNGFVTPNLASKIFEISRTSHLQDIVPSFNGITINFSTSTTSYPSHSHVTQTTTANFNNYVTTRPHHGPATWTHTHSYTGYYGWRPSSSSLAFIIYLGS